MKKSAFTLLEMIFVIVITGIIAKFGSNVLMSSYNSFIFSTAQNRLQAQSEAAVTQIAARLQYRIKGSEIARTSATSFKGLNDALGSEQILEWVGYDVDGWRGSFRGGRYRPNWSGFIDVDNPNATTTKLRTPGSKIKTLEENLIVKLSNGSSTVNDAAIYMIGSDIDIQNGYGYNGTAITTQNQSMKPIRKAGEIVIRPKSGTGNYSGVNIYENYQLAWSAYAIRHETYATTAPNGNSVNEGRLWLYYDYQPWNGEKYTDGKKVLLMDHVDTFGFRSIGDMIKIIVCTTDVSIFKQGAYSICKEKTIF